MSKDLSVHNEGKVYDELVSTLDIQSGWSFMRVDFMIFVISMFIAGREFTVCYLF